MSAFPTVPEFLRRHREMLETVAQLGDAAGEVPGCLQRAYNTWATHYCLEDGTPYPPGGDLAEDARQMAAEIHDLLEWMDFAGIDITNPKPEEAL